MEGTRVEPTESESSSSCLKTKVS